MKKYRVRIEEKQKFIRKLSFLNLREEVANFMYKRTVASATRKDLLLFVLLFFLAIKKEGASRSILFELINENLKKLEQMNEIFFEKQQKLKQGEYHETVEELGLSEILKYDVFFLLLEGILNADILKIKYSDFFEKEPEIFSEFCLIYETFGDRISKTYRIFKDFSIRDDRYDDETGETLDLSKSVHRTVKMRLRRRLDISLQQFTEIREIRSESPLIVDFIQSIDSQIILEIWDKYHLAEYLKNAFDSIKNNISFDLNLGDLVVGYLVWKLTDGKKDPQEKEERKGEFKKKIEYLEGENSLLKALNLSLISTQDNLNREIINLKERLKVLEDKAQLSTEEKQNKEYIILEIRNLENLTISVDEISQ